GLAVYLPEHFCRTPDCAKAHPAFLVNVVPIALGVADGLSPVSAVFPQIIFPAFLPKIRS
ncbi:MAG TPA: hypothetical protein VHV99_16575, partial [Paraburkholderia sp.]|nr:hypothetical protein [Paraburkholderia sp.]